MFRLVLYLTVIALLTTAAFGYQAGESDVIEGPYSTSMDNFNPTASDAGIAGFIGPGGRGVTDQQVSTNYVNPVFSQWASGYVNYIPAPAADPFFIGNEMYNFPGGVPPIWRKPLEALGPVTGDNFHVCVLGDLHMNQIEVLFPWHADYAANQALDFDDPYKIQPGQITVFFDEPIQNGPGPDFAVFENGFISAGGAGVEGQLFAELAYVEVSTDGENFVRFPSVSLTEPINPAGQTDPNFGGTSPYGTIAPTNVYNLAGKHANAYNTASWGTPFNLKDIANDPNVLNGNVDINNINYVKVVDIPGNGFYSDTATQLIDPNTIDPNTGTGGTYYTQDHGIHDAWITWGSGGHDLEAVGAIEQIYGDADSDADVDLIDLARLSERWCRYGNWPQGDFDENGFINFIDFALMAEKWQQYNN